MTTANNLGWTVFGLLCVVLVGAALNRGIYMGSYTEQGVLSQQQPDATSVRVPEYFYKTNCRYLALSGFIIDVRTHLSREEADAFHCPMFWR
jgi:hypothetical protein